MYPVIRFLTTGMLPTATNNSITVDADQGDTGIQIEAGATKRVFHAPGDNKFTADTNVGVLNFDTPDKEVSVE